MSDWPEKRDCVGIKTPRVDGPAKVSGAAKYASDVQPQGLLIGMVLRSKWAAAKIRSINLDKARAKPGIKAVILAKPNAEGAVRYYGEELAAVAGVSKAACLDALAAIDVDAAVQPHVVHEQEALMKDAPQIFPGRSNASEPRETENGDVEAAFNDPDSVILEGYFATQVQIHHPLETHGNTIDFKPGAVTAWASTQGIFSVRDGLAGFLDLPQNQVRVVTQFMGGGFGAKFGPGVEGTLAARLSKEAGAAVKLMLPRLDQSLAVGNRPSSFQKIRLAAKKDGTLTGFDLESYGTGGYASGGATAGGGGGAGFPAPYIYKVPNTRVKQTTVAVNAGSSRAFRAPGHPAASFGMESILDDLAWKLDLDPLDIRLKNDPFEIRRREYQIAVEKFRWREKYRKPGSSEGPVKTGYGLAGATWGGGGRGTKAEVEINPDGSVEVRCGTQDLGTGTRTLVAMVAAEAFGLKPEQINARVGDTRFPPSGGSGGSTTAASVSPAILDTCQKALAELQETSGISDARGANWKIACRKLGVNPLVVQGAWREGLSSSGAGGVQMAEVDVDIETGVVRVRKILCVQDCGLIVNPLTCESQINGGIIMGLGYALFEERVMDGATGVVLNPNFETYKLPGAADIPDIEVVLLDMPERGVIGVGEPATIPTASAIANAVSNATGVRMRSLPITPSKILSALGKIPNPVPEIGPENFFPFGT